MLAIIHIALESVLVPLAFTVGVAGSHNAYSVSVNSSFSISNLKPSKFTIYFGPTLDLRCAASRSKVVLLANKVHRQA